jgi:hypothetical protein
MTVGEGGHTHSVPSCDTVNADRVCFIGKAKVWNAAARWQPHNSSWWIGGEYWLKKEKGRLDSIYGIPDYEGEVNGGWLDFGYRVSSELTLIARIEELRISNYLNGANAGLIAEQAGIASADDTPRGFGLVAVWQPMPAVRLLGEWHRDNADGDTDTVVLLRLQMNYDYRYAFN